MVRGERKKEKKNERLVAFHGKVRPSGKKAEAARARHLMMVVKKGKRATHSQKGKRKEGRGWGT